MMKFEKVTDERIVSQRRKIQSDSYSVLVYCLLISILVQQFILNAPFSQFAAELICFIGAAIYAAVRYLSIGIDIWDSNSSIKKLLFSSVFSGLICIVFLVVIAGQRNVRDLIMIFVIFTVAFFTGHYLLQYLVKKKQKEIDKELNEE